MNKMEEKEVSIITKSNFIVKLLSILINIDNISKEAYVNFLKRADNILTQNEMDILINLKKTDTSKLKKLQSLLSKINEFNFFIIKKEIFLFFEYKESKFYDLLELYSDYFIEKIRKKYEKLKKEKRRINSLHNRNKIIRTNLFKNFSKEINEVNIYIDEVWPDSVEPENSNTLNSMNIRAIAGLIYLGKSDYKKLPRLKTHLRKEGKAEKFKYKNFSSKLKDLINCNNAIPFFMPIELPDGLNVQRYYFELLQISLKILLGWVLPQEGNFVKVNVYCEHFSNYEENTDKTEFFDGLFENLILTTNRFSRYIINKVVWKGKNFGYIPYADLIGYVGLQHREFTKEIAREIKLNEWDTFVPISLEIYKQLERLDNFDTQKDIENLFNLLINLKNSKFSKPVFKLLKNEFIKNDDFKNNVIDVIESYYLNQNRDMDKLRLVYRYFTLLIKKLNTRELLYWTQIKIILIKLQYANHEGNPKMIETLLNEYKKIRNDAFYDNQELILYTDLNFVVYLNDLFKFDKSMNVIKELTENFGFSFYSRENQAKALSTYGQVLALTGNYNEANNKFICDS